MQIKESLHFLLKTSAVSPFTEFPGIIILIVSFQSICTLAHPHICTFREGFLLICNKTEPFCYETKNDTKRYQLAGV